MTVFLNQSAEFECETRGGLSGWKVDGTLYNSLSAEIRSDLKSEDRGVSEEGNSIIALTIPARNVYNETNIQCVTIEFGVALDESETVLLKIQGLLSPVADLATTSNASSIIISWSDPFSLNVTDVDPDIWYSVLIYNVTDNPTAINCTDCINITETDYNFTPDYPSPCHKYIFTVIPLNGAGQGQDINLTGYTAQEPPSNISVSSDIVIEDDGENYYSATINFLGDVENVCTYTLRVLNPSVSFISYSDFVNGTVIFKVPRNDVEPNREYEVFFEISNAAGSINTSTTTFKICACQDATANINGGKLSIRGNLMAESSAQGCFFYLTGKEDHCVAVQRRVDSVYHQTNYTGFENICVYDIEENGLPHSVPALTLTVDGSETQYYEPSEPLNSTTPEHLLSRVEVLRNGLRISVSCEFSSNASCVLVYLSNHTTLNVREYNDSIIFPVSLTVDEETTLFIFGKNGALQSEPLLTLREKETHALYETGAGGGTSTSSSSSGVLVGELVGSVVGCVVAFICCVVAGIVLLMLVRRQKNHQDQESPPRSENNNTSLPSKVNSLPGTPEPPECVNIGVKDSPCSRENDNSTSTVTQTLSQDSEKEERSGESKYARVEAVRGPRPPPCLDQRVKYEMIDLKATKRHAHPQGLLYAELPQNRGEGEGVRKKADTVQYVTIIPHSVPTPTTTDNELEEKNTTDSVKGPPTMEEVKSLLYDAAGQWKEIAAGLGFDEDMIDEIDTNNQTDELCLLHMVEIWVSRLAPSWETLSLVLRDIGRNDLAQKAWSEDSKTTSKQTSDDGVSSGVARGDGDRGDVARGDGDSGDAARGDAARVDAARGDGDRGDGDRGDGVSSDVARGDGDSGDAARVDAARVDAARGDGDRGDGDRGDGDRGDGDSGDGDRGDGDRGDGDRGDGDSGDAARVDAARGDGDRGDGDRGDGDRGDGDRGDGDRGDGDRGDGDRVDGDRGDGDSGDAARVDAARGDGDSGDAARVDATVVTTSRKIQKWFSTGSALGFNGPANSSFGGSSSQLL